MKRTFLARRNALLTSRDVSWGVFALVFVLLVLLLRFLAPNAFWWAFSPVFRSADALSAQTHFLLSGFENTANLALRNEQLVRENAALTSENQALLQKATNLGALSGPAASGKAAPGIIAGIIARPPASPYDTLVLSLGANADVAVGMEAFGDGGVPLGVVTDVLPDFSRVTLFSAFGMSVDGWVGRTNIPLTVLGGGGGAMRASLARSAGVKVGDGVFIPGPGALPVGSVVRIDSDPSSPSVTLQIEPALNPFSVTWAELRATGPAFTGSLSWATSTPL